MLSSYIDTLSVYYPNIKAESPDGGFEYELLLHTGGDPIPPKEELDLKRFKLCQEKKWEQIQQERDRRKLEGGYQVDGNWFHSDTFSRTQQIALVMMGANLPQNIMWKTLGSSFILMTPTLASHIFQAASLSDMTLFTVAEQKKQQMLASPTPHLYDHLTGWPKIYGE